MTSRLPRPTVALLIATAISLALVGSARITGLGAAPSTSGSMRAVLPVDPTDVAASITATDLRPSVEPRHVAGFAWLLTVAAALVSLLMGWTVLGDTAGDRRRGRPRIGPPGRAPPVVALAP